MWPRFSASWRSGRKSFMQLSGGPAWVGGAAKGEFPIGAPGAGKDAGAAPNEEEGIGAVPNAGARLADDGGAAPFTGGKAGSFTVPTLPCPGSGAGNAPCASTCPAWNIITAAASGAIKWRIINAIPSGPQTSSRQERDSVIRYFTIAASG